MKESEKEIKHLFARASFGLHPLIFQKIKKHSRTEAVDALFKSSESFSNITHFPDIRKEKKDVGGLKVLKMILKSKKDLQQLNLVWLDKMATSNETLREKMTFFWHNHFATSTPFPVLMQEQNNMIRKHALGNFRELVTEIAMDPAMIFYLNNHQNKKDAPNENFARELMELFTLGRGNYTEQDIKESARAFTGWHVGKDGYFTFHKKDYDDGAKTFMGKTGNWGGHDIIRIILDQEETSVFISRKIYKSFISPNIDEAFVSQMASRFRKSNYDIGDLMRFVFLSDHFYIKENRGVLIKSPVELIVEYKVLFQLRMKNAVNMIKLQRGLGQVLFMPPNVAGWPGDRNWIDSASLLVRVNLPSLFSGKITYTPKDKELPETESIKDKSKLPFLCSMNFEKFESGFKNSSVFDLIIHPTSVEEPSVMKQLNSAEEKAIYVMSLPEFQLH